MKYCTKCLYAEKTNIKIFFDELGQCPACVNVKYAKEKINWDQRLTKLKKLFRDQKKNSDYDVLIGVSGGKDSYFQADLAINVLGLNALLVTYYGNNFTEDGEYNLRRMKEIFKCDHLILKPDTETLIKMNRLGFYIQGDMNWHNHCGIYTYPIQEAIKNNVKFILWGEHDYMYRVGMYSYDDYVEFTQKYRKEHSLRGYEWYNFTDEGLEKLGFDKKKENLTKKNLHWAIYPSDHEIKKVGLRGIYASNYVYWDGRNNAKISQEKYGWKKYSKEFQRTYSRISNLDDMHENGAHDYLKFIKFGYGRATDHSTKDIRLGYMTREEGIEMVKKYDHIRPTEDLDRWYKYVNIDEDEFNQVSDTFRDPSVWYIKNNKWYKNDIWGGSSSYGEVFLSSKDKEKYFR
mgnify:CR=1 FL=1